MRVWVESSLKNVFRDAMYDNWSDDSYEFVMAKNEREAFQILLREDHEFCIHSVTFSDALCGDHIIPAENLSYGYVEYEYISANSRYVSKEDAIRVAPGYFPDAISNSRSWKVSAKETQPIWITLYTPKDTVPGLYTGHVTVHTSVGDFQVNYTAEVCNVTIPDPENAAFQFLIWQQIINSHGSVSSRPTPIFREYGYDRWTPEWWEVVEDIADKMYKNRINNLWVETPTLLLDGGSYIDEDGNYVFNWSRFDEYIEYFLKRGGIKILVGSHITTCYYRTLEHPLLMLKRNAAGEMCVDMEFDYTGSAATHWLHQYLPALMQHLQEKGWIDMWYQHVGDECFTEEQIRNYQVITNIMRQCCPEIRYGDAVMDVKSSQQQVDMGVKFMVPLEETWEKNIDYYTSLQQQGVEVFPYTCCGPIGSWPKCFIDLPVWNIRTLIWRIFGTNSHGYLCWSMNYWDHFSCTEHQKTTVDEWEYKGDNGVIYPDPNSNRVRSSIRMEVNRDGAEDFELLTILKKHDPAHAKALADRIAKDCKDQYCRDIKEMINARKELVRAASQVEIGNAEKAIDPRVLAGFIDQKA